MAATVRYLTTRNGVFRYERWVPEHLQQAVGQKLFRRSLRTKIQSEALASAIHAEREYETLIAQAANDTGAVVAPAKSIVASARLTRPVTSHDLDMLESERRRMEVRHWEQLYLRADGSPAHADALGDLVERYEQDAAERRHAIITPGFDDPERKWLPSPARDARDAIELLGLDAPAGSPGFGAVVAAIRRGYLAGAHDVAEMLAGKGKPRIDAPAPAIAGPLLSEAVAGYVSHKKPAGRTVRQIETLRDEFVGLIGDKPLAALTRKDFEAFVEMRANRTVGGKSDAAIARPASLQTVKKSIGLLRAAIGHAIDHKDFDFDGPNPASGIKVTTYVKPVDKAVMPDKRPFKVGELNKILEHPWFTGCAGLGPNLSHQPGKHRLTGAEYWAPIVAMHTGCRVAELAGLRVAEVMLDDPHPHFVIRDNEHRRTKRQYQRDVPILDVLIDLGFADYVERIREAGADRLFPDWAVPVSPKGLGQAWYNSAMVKSFNRTVIPAQLRDTLIAGARRDVTFHSFRGAFKSMLQSTRYGLHPNVINEVIGHAKDELDRRYIGTIAIEETYPAIRACRYEGLIIPKAP